MSSFQSFKSFMKIEESNIADQISKAPLTDENQKDQQKIDCKQTGGNQCTQQEQKTLRRFKKTGSVCNFINKVYSMLQQKEIQSIISWTKRQQTFSSKNLSLEKILDIHSQANSNSFQIFDIQKFQEIILPKYFKHSNMSSFVRQLNMYGFHKLRGQKNNFEFQHEKFQKNRKELLTEIRRKSPEFMGISSSHLEDPSLKGTLQNLRAIDDKVNNHCNKFVNTQQEIESNREEPNESNLFPSQGFIPLKKISLDDKVQLESENSMGKDKLKKLELIEQQNNRLKNIKTNKLQKIKNLNSANKQQIQTKFSKILLTFFTLKIKQEFERPKLNFKNQIESDDSQKGRLITIQSFADHIMSGSEVQSFQTYKRMIEDLLEQNKSLKKAQ